jgi:uncharacterized integral membrane protein
VKIINRIQPSSILISGFVLVFCVESLYCTFLPNESNAKEIVKRVGVLALPYLACFISSLIVKDDYIRVFISITGCLGLLLLLLLILIIKNQDDRSEFAHFMPVMIGIHAIVLQYFLASIVLIACVVDRLTSHRSTFRRKKHQKTELTQPSPTDDDARQGG